MLAKRRAAAAKYRPKEVRLLIVAEAPPCDTEGYFYFEDVPRHDWLFRYVYEGCYGEKPTRARKAAHLARLRDVSGLAAVIVLGPVTESVACVHPPPLARSARPSASASPRLCVINPTTTS